MELLEITIEFLGTLLLEPGTRDSLDLVFDTRSSDPIYPPGKQGRSSYHAKPLPLT